MNKDYAKKRRMLDATRTKERQGAVINHFSLWGWMTVGIFLGVLLSGAIYWKINYAPPKSERGKVIKKLNPASLNDKVSNVAKEASARFDFYKVLPNLTAEITEESPTLTPAIVPAPHSPLVSHASEPKTTASEKYLIQAGSFKHIKQAEELKANLTLSGFEARIQTVKIADTQIWYRVTVGPFEGKEKAQASRRKLDEAHSLHSLVLKMQV